MNLTMTSIYLIVFAVLLVAVNATTLRGTSVDIQEKSTRLNRHRNLQESTCTLYRKCVTYLPTEEYPDGHHEDSWVCELSEEDSRRMNVQFVDIVESPTIATRIANANSGESTLTMSEAIVDTKSPRMYIPEDATFFVGTVPVEPRKEKRRQLAKKGPATSGALKTLVIRVFDKNDLAPESSIEQLQDDVFDDSVSLKTQTEACSYGKLKIEPFQGKTPSNQYINNGIVDVKMDFDITSGEPGMDQAAMRAAREKLGDLKDPMFDLVMFCFPPGRDFLAFAYPNSKYSFYNNKHCGYVGTQMHEVGHNLGLAHSGELDQGEYGDGTGFMGSAPSGDDVQMCFNPQKNYQLGWYADKVKTINPLDGVSRREFILNGISDYRKNDDALVVLRLRQTKLQIYDKTGKEEQQDYYIGFNHATGINTNTTEDLGRVTIVRKEFGAPDKYGQSMKIGALLPGERKVIKNFNDEGDVQITFYGVKNGEAKIIITDKDEPLEAPAGNCKKFTIEINTDKYPGDNSWFVSNTGGWGEVAATSPVYTEKFKKYVQEICVPMGAKAQTYKFTIFDSYKDGMCCSQGKGSYKAYNDKGDLIFSGGKKFASMEHLIQVPRDPHPPPATPVPTPAPTMKPTPAPPCESHTIEVMTDRYPKDSSWKMIGFNEFLDETVVAESSKYNQKYNLHTTNVCLIEGRKYEFRFIDNHGDGICCDSGKGYYRVLNSSGEVVVDSGKEDQRFKLNIHTIEVDNQAGDTQTPEPTQTPTQTPTQMPTQTPTQTPTKMPTKTPTKTCADDQTFRVGKKKNYCKFVGKKLKKGVNKCNNKMIKEACPLTCGTCCANNDAFYLGKKKSYDCNWVATMKDQGVDKCNSISRGQVVKYACPLACGLCTIPN